jgi:NitT/TauT family transport system substrate-binding protein
MKMPRKFLKSARLAIAGLLLAGMFAATSSAHAEGKIRFAFPDVATVEYTHLLAAFERAKERGVDIEVTYFTKEELATQAVVNGDVDVGFGSPFALIQKVNAPIRFFLQLSKLRFFVVVNGEKYKSWKDLDGQEIAVHARGSGTEAVIMMMAQREGIKFSQVSYVPGSEVRSGAMLQGNINATVVDSINRDLLMREAPGKFIVLPVDTTNATNDALYANVEFLEANAAAVDVLVESVLTSWRDLTANPQIVAEWREKYKILPDAPADAVAEMVPYYRENAKEKTFPVNGGSPESAKADLAFYAAAGQVQGDPDTLDVNDFWYFAPQDRALAKLGRVDD